MTLPYSEVRSDGADLHQADTTIKGHADTKHSHLTTKSQQVVKKELQQICIVYERLPSGSERIKRRTNRQRIQRECTSNFIYRPFLKTLPKSSAFVNWIIGKV